MADGNTPTTPGGTPPPNGHRPEGPNINFSLLLTFCAFPLLLAFCVAVGTYFVIAPVPNPTWGLALVLLLTATATLWLLGRGYSEAVVLKVLNVLPKMEIRCRFIFSGKNDELTSRQEARERRIVTTVKPFAGTLRVTNPARKSRASSRKRVLHDGGQPPL